MNSLCVNVIDLKTFLDNSKSNSQNLCLTRGFIQKHEVSYE